MGVGKERGMKWCVEAEDGEQCVFTNKGVAREFMTARFRQKPIMYAVVRCCGSEIYCKRVLTICPYCGLLFAQNGEEREDDGKSV